MKSALLMPLFFFTSIFNAESQTIISHVDKSGIQFGSNNRMIISHYSSISAYQTKKYNKILIEAVRKTIKDKSEQDNNRFDSILMKILHAVESIPKALELAKDSLKMYNVTIDENKFNTLNREVLLLNKDGDFTKYGNEFVFDPKPTLKKGEVAFKSDFISSPLFPLKKNNNYGYIDTNGVLVIPYSYDYASSFNENLAIVKKNMKWMLIDTKNQKILELPGADTLYQNVNMLVPYFLNNDKNLYIYNLKDSTNFLFGSPHKGDDGYVVIPSYALDNPLNLWYPNLKTYETLFFYGGQILIRKSVTEHYKILSYNSEILNDLDYSSASISLTTGIAAVKKDNLWGFYDLKANEEIISPRYKWVENFNFDYTLIETLENKYGVIDKNNHSYYKIGEWKIERLKNNLLKFKSVGHKLNKKQISFITDASLNCIQGNCSTPE